MKNKLQKILDKLDNINYGFVDSNNNIYQENDKKWANNFDLVYRLQSPQALIKSKYGVCWDQVELERYYLNQDKISHKSYFIIAHNKDFIKTHTFIVVKDDKHYWLEHSWETYKGIHEYETFEELILDIKNKFKDDLKQQNITNYKLELYEYSKPKYNINCIEFMNYCQNNKKININ